MTQQWVHCPICGGKTRTKIREDTIARNMPVFCPKCNHSFVMDIRDNECKKTEDRKTVTENYVLCGRTENRGNWVSVRRGNFSIRLDDDCKKPISQISLKEMCIDLLDYLNIV